MPSGPPNEWKDVNLGSQILRSGPTESWPRRTPNRSRHHPLRMAHGKYTLHSVGLLAFILAGVFNAAQRSSRSDALRKVEKLRNATRSWANGTA
jgi:hypothetical protein